MLSPFSSTAPKRRARVQAKFDAVPIFLVGLKKTSEVQAKFDAVPIFHLKRNLMLFPFFSGSWRR